MELMVEAGALVCTCNYQACITTGVLFEVPSSWDSLSFPNHYQYTDSYRQIITLKLSIEAGNFLVLNCRAQRAAAIESNGVRVVSHIEVELAEVTSVFPTLLDAHSTAFLCQ